MSIEEIRSYRNAKPFRPFTLILADGRKLSVPAPTRIAIAPWGRLGIFVDGVPHTPQVNEVVSVEPGLQRPAAA